VIRFALRQHCYLSNNTLWICLNTQLNDTRQFMSPTFSANIDAVNFESPEHNLWIIRQNDCMDNLDATLSVCIRQRQSQPASEMRGQYLMSVYLNSSVSIRNWNIEFLRIHDRIMRISIILELNPRDSSGCKIICHKRSSFGTTFRMTSWYLRKKSELRNSLLSRRRGRWCCCRSANSLSAPDRCPLALFAAFSSWWIFGWIG